ncbi:hypothetical protein CJD36_017400 [Flavipsychrobacter stenotrophus]|uniref:Uncharacterized protein n=1 Tax=Flavipsychrobacter stenotrophus TaxID=2077091 RepID=A0A2S7SSX7_9BACT|nr:hypothetical protein CJD36_017400 [Flavipsychrobacter stenotrophus]
MSAGFAVVSIGFTVLSGAGGGVAGGVEGTGANVSVFGASPLPLPQEATKKPMARTKKLSLINFIIVRFKWFIYLYVSFKKVTQL